MMLRIFILYFLFYKVATTDHRKRRIEDIEKELVIDGIMFILNDEGIYIPPIKKNKIGLKDDIDDISFTSYYNNLSFMNTVHKKLDEDLINYVLDILDKGYFNKSCLNETPKEHSCLSYVDFNLNNRTLHSEYDEFRKHNELHNINNYNYSPSTSTYQLQTTEFLNKDNDLTLRNDKNIGTSEQPHLTKKYKLEKITEVSISSNRHNSKSSNENLYCSSKSLIYLLSSHDYITAFYSEIKNHFTAIFTKKYNDWLMIRFDNIKAMINQIKLYKNSKSPREFKEIFDEKIMTVLGKLNLKASSKYTMYALDDYKSFVVILKENFNEMKIYSLIIEYYIGFKEEMFYLPYREFVFLFKFFPDFPELITLGSLLKHGRDERLLLYFRIIHLMILENKSRKELIKTVILFLIKISFMTPKKRTKDLDFISKEKINMEKHFKESSICNKDHSQFCFLMWEFHPNKNRTMRFNSKADDGYVYNITICNMEHFRAAVQTYLFQHIMFIEHHNLNLDRLKELINKSFAQHICAFCLFNEYLDLVREEISII